MPENTQTTSSAPELTPLLSWTAQSRPHFERSARWYAIGGGVVLAVAAYAILTGSWPLALVAMLCGALYFLLRNQTPPLHSITIYDQGVQMDDAFWTWNDLNGYWLIKTPSYTQLCFEPKNKRRAQLIILTGEIDPILLKTTISPFITEFSDRTESLVDIFIRLCKL